MNRIALTVITLSLTILLPLNAMQAPADAGRMQPPSQAEQLRAIVLEPIWTLAQMLYEDGLLPEARREFDNVALVQRGRNESAAEAFWMIAEIDYARGNLRNAGRALDRVAREARGEGDRDLQARALFEAAVMYGKTNDRRLAATRLSQLEQLLSSDDVSLAVRTMIERRTELI